MATYRLPRMLTLLAWEAALQHGPYATEQAWSEANPEDQLNLDFSPVEFADFGASLHAPHWGANAVRILDRAATGAQEPSSSPGLPKSDPHNDPYQRRRVFPFQWLEPMPTAQLRESESFVAVSAGLVVQSRWRGS